LKLNIVSRVEVGSKWQCSLI